MLIDTCTALDSGLRIFAAIGIRTAFDRASEFLGVNPAKRLDEKLDELLAQGKIGTNEREMLDALTDAGSAAAHRSWRPSAHQLEIMLASIEGFICRTFILGYQAERLREAVPPKPPRQKKLMMPKPPPEPAAA
ncbi:DUF4145 domain-containing protein [Microvirga sp. KLBC 81]|uniref:DUF4145 domain-containing protein n=1 Tax=Microvirga sp. KLBC 81 TaxID=1862707 RepID=UPI001403525A